MTARTMPFSAALLTALLALPASAVAVDLAFVDDRGEPVAEPLEVCTVAGLDTSCDRVEPGETVRGDGFDSLSVEGATHGPTRIERQALVRDDGGRLVVVVPRKAAIVLRALPPAGEAVALTLYDAGSPDFRRPAHRVARVDTDRVLVPAGEFVLSLSTQGRAPDLHHVVLPPAGERQVAYAARDGWSAVLRAVTGPAASPVAGAEVEIYPASGYGSDSSRPPQATTGKRGLALFSGLPYALAEARVRHPDLLETTAPGLVATPGSFAFEEVALPRGGSLSAWITLLGEPVGGARCTIREPASARPEDSGKTPAERALASTDAEGSCRVHRLPPGRWMLEVRGEGSGEEALHYLESFWIEDGREVEVRVDLEPIVIEGSVLRGDEPAPGYRVVVLSQNPEGALEPRAEATSDEEGGYRAVVWRPDGYFLSLRSAAGKPAAFERLWAGTGGAEHDFRLAPSRLEGSVVDEEGRGIPGAVVFVRWNRSRTWSAAADEQGRFAYDLDAGGGSAELTAHEAGYDLVEPVHLELAEDATPPPVILRMRRNDDLRGRVTSAAGAPLAGALVAAYQVAPGSWPVELGAVATEADGGFVVPRAKSGPTRLFVTGPGCPLSSLDVTPEQAAEEDFAVGCPAVPSNLVVRLAGGDGTALAGKALTLQHGEHVIPSALLSAHLGALGLPGVTDGRGRLALVGLEPGTWSVYLEEASNPETIAAGLPHGHLTSIVLVPLSSQELSVTVPSGF